MKPTILTIEEMLRTLKANPNVLGLLEYGDPHKSDNYATGDYDLFVVLQDKDYDVEGLHFYVGEVPVDLNIRALGEIQGLEFVEGFEAALLDARIIYDPTGKVTQALEALRERQEQHSPLKISEHSLALTRHGHRHVFDKIKGRLDSMPLFCKFLLQTNIYWLLRSHFRVRNLPFKGPKASFEYLKENEPEIYKSIEDFYRAESLEEKVKISQKLTDLVLEPVGGPWRKDEVLAFGDEKTKELQRKGKELFLKLFSKK